MEFDLTMIDALLTTTRAVRRRLDFERPVPREVIAECLALSIQAPTGGNRQTWRWIVVDGGDNHAALAELYRDAARELLVPAANAALAQGDEQTNRVYAGALWLAENMAKVPVFAIPCVEGRPGEDAPRGRLAGVYGSIFPAVWSFQLALRSRGLGSTLTTLLNFFENETARILGVPDSVMMVAMLPVAYTRGTDFKPAKRPPASEITHWNGW